jgi:hypothetical protein
MISAVRYFPLSFRHPRESGGPEAADVLWTWMPAFAGMTEKHR